jgi:hypothetical protein
VKDTDYFFVIFDFKDKDGKYEQGNRSI